MRTRALIPAVIAGLTAVVALTQASLAEGPRPASPDTTEAACDQPWVNIWAPASPDWSTKIIEFQWPQIAGTFDYTVEVCDDPVTVVIHHMTDGAETVSSFDLVAEADLTEPIVVGETVWVQILLVGTVVDEQFAVATVSDPPPLDCARVICGWGLEEIVYPDWVQVTMNVADVRSATAVVRRSRDRAEIGRYPMAIADGVAEVRLTGLAPSTSYTTEYVVTDDRGQQSVEVTGGFVTGAR